MEVKNISIDDTIKLYEDEISELKGFIDETKRMSKRFAGFEHMIENIEEMKEKIEVYLRTAKILKENGFVEYVENYNVEQQKILTYKNELEKDLQLLVSEGFDDMSQILTFYNEICQTGDLLEIKTRKESVIARLDKNAPLVDIYNSTLSKLLYEYAELEHDYKKIINVLNSKEARCAISEETTNYILDNTSLVHLIYTNNVYHKIGQSRSLNPMFYCQFHNSGESNLDMRVRIHKNYFQCFGCGIEGNQINYLMEYEGITYEQAIQLLAEIYLIDIPNNPFRSNENIELVNRYRNSLISDEYKAFLIESYNNVKTTNPGSDEIYSVLFDQIERVKKGEYAPDFEYKEKTKKFKLDSPVDLGKINLNWNL